MTPAVYQRLLQFRSGPHEHRFYMCEAHKDAVDPCFFTTPREPILPVLDLDDEHECDYCREG